MEQCKICKKMYKRITTSHLRIHGLSLQKYKQLHGGNGFKPSTKSKKRIISELGLSIVVTVLASLILMPVVSRALISIGIPKIGVSPLETIDPRIESTFPQNNDIIDDEKVSLFAILSDEGGSGIDWDKSRIELRRGTELIQLANLKL